MVKKFRKVVGFLNQQIEFGKFKKLNMYKNKVVESMPSAVIDLFCGVGGLTHGLELSGLNVIAGFDIEESCRYAYEYNNNAIFVNQDIALVTKADLDMLYPENTLKIMVGCAPCQPFSNIRRDIGKTDK